MILIVLNMVHCKYRFFYAAIRLALQKLDAFVRKYYINQLLRGALILLCCLLFYILTASISEYFLYLPVALKVFIVALFSISGISAFLFLIFGINKNGKDWQSIIS